MAVNSEVSAFLEDLFDNLAAIEDGIVQLESNPKNPEYLNAIFRAAHTIKGNAAMMGLTNLVALGHALETTLQECINGKLDVGRDALRLFSECRTTMSEIGNQLRIGKDTNSIDILQTTDRLQALLLDEESSVNAVSMDGVRRMQIKLRIAKAELAPVVRAFLVETKIAEMGTIVSKEPPEEKIETPEFLASDRELIFVVDTGVSPKEITENLNIDLIESIEVLDKGAGNSPVHEKIEREKDEMVAEVQTSSGDTIRLSVQTIDKLLNLAGELVLANGGLLQIADELTATAGAENHALRLSEKNREIFHIASEIQNIVMQSRMLPIEHVFSRFTRFVRDYAESAGKAIRLETSGEKTELDKRVIDEIVKPLTHIIRNSLDHGIETREERSAVGKNPVGVLKISATQSGSSILITVEDDGRGLSIEKIRQKAIEKNLVRADEAALLSPKEIQEFIFMRGFSTKDTADDLSGRGFGMDIVRESIERLSGDLSIYSVEGKGTRMVISLPLTLAILSTLTFKVRNDVFALPLTVIEESLRVLDGSVVELDEREVLHSQNQILPFLRLDRILGYPPIEEKEVGYRQAILVEIHGEKFALGIDEFLKRRDLVVKSLNENYKHVQGIAGASMLGDNEIVFILDLNEVIELYKSGERRIRSESMSTNKEAKENKIEQPIEGMVTKDKEVRIEKLFDPKDKEVFRNWISQSNKAAIKGIQMLTGTSAITVKRSKGVRVKASNSRQMMERIVENAENIYLLHLPMIPDTGSIDLILKKDSAEKMARLLFSAAGIDYNDEFDPSPLLEITNILGSAYTNTLTFLTETSVEPATPSLLGSSEEIKSLIETRLSTPHAEILVVDNEFHIQNENIAVELVIYLNS
ncbi:MAG: hypothetical protein LDLANPLL_00169 [Turneriella sp.]|nr:hypothetical protein [Turneriella sp.]